MILALFGFVVLLTLSFLRVPIAFSMVIVGFFGMALANGWEGALANVGQTAFDSAINYELSVPGFVTLVIYDLKGAEVKTLVQEHQDANYHQVIWNGFNNTGQSVSSGRYLLKMSAPGYTESITMTLLK